MAVRKSKSLLDFISKMNLTDHCDNHTEINKQQLRSIDNKLKQGKLTQKCIEALNEGVKLIPDYNIKGIIEQEQEQEQSQQVYISFNYYNNIEQLL